MLYVVPRLNPDGKPALAERPRYVRSSVRKYPLPEPEDGLQVEDLDGDGRILQMRVPDPNGNWKKHEQDERLMVRRDPDEFGGEYYRVARGIAPELRRRADQDPGPARDARSEPELPGRMGAGGGAARLGAVPGVGARDSRDRAGDDRPVVRPPSYHTFSGVHLRPFGSHPDDHFPTGDLRAYQQVGEVATQLTGYPAVSVFHEFAYVPKRVDQGTSDDFFYDQRGIFSWTTEFWSPQRQAGITDYKYIDWIRDHPPEDKLLRWSDEKLGGRGYGLVRARPPTARASRARWLGLVLRVGERSVRAARGRGHPALGLRDLPLPDLAAARDALARRRAGRRGRLEGAPGAREHRLAADERPRALERKRYAQSEVELELPEDAARGRREVDEGGGSSTAASTRTTLWWLTNDATNDLAKLEWGDRAPAGGELAIIAKHERAEPCERVPLAS